MVSTSQSIVDGVIFRTTDEEVNTIFGSADDAVWWQVYSSSWYNEDTGEQKFRIRHYLEMDILASDIIEFEISFRPNSKPYATSTSVIGEDYFICKLTQDSDSPQFWTADISDGYYQCTGSVDGNGDYCDGTSYSTKYQETQDAVSWATPYDDDDEDDFWCTHAGNEDTWSPYECTAIQCPVWRDLDTLDASQDLSFTTTADDQMNIRIGRAMLYINSETSGFETPAAGPLEATL